jgi:hypothetical protein
MLASAFVLSGDENCAVDQESISLIWPTAVDSFISSAADKATFASSR